MLAKAQQ